MASGVTDWGSAQFLSWAFGITAPPSAFYIALTTDEPGTDTDGTVMTDLEPDPSLNYNRISVPTGSANWSDPDGLSYITNLNDISFDTPSSDWPVCTHFAVCDSLTDGEVFFYGEFDIPVVPNATMPAVLVAGSIILTFGSYASSISEA